MKRTSNVPITAIRVLVIMLMLAAFTPNFNPARLSEKIPDNMSLFTIITSYSSAISANFVRDLDRAWIAQSTLMLLYIGALVVGVGVAVAVLTVCLSMGNNKMRRLGLKMAVIASLFGFSGCALLLRVGQIVSTSIEAERVKSFMPVSGFLVFGILFGLILVVSAVSLKVLPKPDVGEKYTMEAKYRLFLMILPFLMLVALFAYLPLWGWRYAFFDYSPGTDLSMERFAGFKWFRLLFENAATRADIVRVMKNTFALSGIGIATSWLPMVFAIFLSEIKSARPKKMVQTLTTIPNFISWVLVYSVAFAIFSTEGFLNWALSNMNIIEEGKNYLMETNNMWLKMWLWGTWKGLGWSAIIYLAGISSIDPQLYEAALADGAGRFKRMWHITVPGLMPTFFVLLILAIANMLSNGLEQYLVFSNDANRSSIEVLDLYVYNLGLAGDSNNLIPAATVIGMLKSIISVTLLFAANKFSKWVRGESIV